MIFEKLLLDYENIIFDCDGVILDSNKIKTDAFIKLFDNYPKDKINQLVDYHKKYGGISRYKKILYFFNNIMKENISENNLNILARKFGKISLGGLKKSNLIPGLLDILIFLKNNKKKLFVVSGSDEKDLIKVLKFKKLYKYFNIIKGSPKNKKDNLMEILPNLLDQGYFFVSKKKNKKHQKSL